MTFLGAPYGQGNRPSIVSSLALHPPTGPISWVPTGTSSPYGLCRHVGRGWREGTETPAWPQDRTTEKQVTSDPQGFGSRGLGASTAPQQMPANAHGRLGDLGATGACVARSAPQRAQSSCWTLHQNQPLSILTMASEENVTVNTLQMRTLKLERSAACPKANTP